MAEDLDGFIEALLREHPEREDDPETVGKLREVSRRLATEGINSLGTQKDEIGKIADLITIQNKVVDFFAENARTGMVGPENDMAILQMFHESVIAPLATTELSNVPIGWFVIPSKKSANPSIQNKIAGIDDRFRSRYNRSINVYIRHSQNPPINYDIPTLRDFQSTSPDAMLEIPNVGQEAIKYLSAAFHGPTS